ncbi:MAG: CBS domain-containing protein [Nitrospirota bacterium]
MKVSQIMTKEVHIIEPTQTLKECAEVMNKKRANGLVVVDDGKVVGVITKADIFKAILPRYPDIVEDERHMTDLEYIEERAHKLYEVKVKEIMGTPPITVSSDAPVVRAGSQMILRRVKQLPVLDKNKLAGIITLTDIITYLLKKIK